MSEDRDLIAHPLRRKYNRLLARFEKYEFQQVVVVQAFGLMRRVLIKLHNPLLQGDIFKIYVVCFYTAFKLLIDDSIMFIEDIAHLTDMNPDMVEQLE